MDHFGHLAPKMNCITARVPTIFVAMSGKYLTEYLILDKKLIIQIGWPNHAEIWTY